MVRKTLRKHLRTSFCCTGCLSEVPLCRAVECATVSTINEQASVSTLAQQTASIGLSVNQSYFQRGFLTCPLFRPCVFALTFGTTKVVQSAESNVGALRCASFVRDSAVACVSSAFWTAQSELTSVFVAGLRFLRVLAIHKRSLGLAL